jgi:hypothetical protein
VRKSFSESGIVEQRFIEDRQVAVDGLQSWLHGDAISSCALNHVAHSGRRLGVHSIAVPLPNSMRNHIGVCVERGAPTLQRICMNDKDESVPFRFVAQR